MGENSMALFGPRWPLKKGTKDSYEMYDNIDDQISFYMKCLILTSSGENLSDPNYGVGLRRFLFEQNLDSVQDAILSKVSSQIASYLPYLDILDMQIIDASKEMESNTMTLRIVYRIPSDTLQRVFELNLNPDTTIGFY